MKAYWNTLNDRERWMVIAAALFLIIYSYYGFIYSPLKNKVNQASSQIVEKKATLEWMKKIRLQNRPSQAKQTLNNSQLLSMLSNNLKDNLQVKTPYQLQQTGSGEIQLSYDEVPFLPFITWLAKINESYALTVKQFEAEKTPTPGVVKLRVVLSAS